MNCKLKRGLLYMPKDEPLPLTWQKEEDIIPKRLAELWLQDVTKGRIPNY